MALRSRVNQTPGAAAPLPEGVTSCTGLSRPAAAQLTLVTGPGGTAGNETEGKQTDGTRERVHTPPGLRMAPGEGQHQRAHLIFGIPRSVQGCCRSGMREDQWSPSHR